MTMIIMTENLAMKIIMNKMMMKNDIRYLGGDKQILI